MASPRTLRVVDKLTITFLVDNSIEWMTKLPPGFTHELNQHVIHDHEDGTIDPEKETSILNFDKFCCGAHGFGALIETQVNGDPASHFTLFDTGPDSQSLVRNIKAMRPPIERIERVVTSHWHSDHTGGLLSFLNELRTSNKTTNSQPVVIDVHPDRPILRGASPPSMNGNILFALPPDPTFAEIETAGGKIETHAEGHAVSGDTVWVSGEIPRVTEYESGLVGAMRWVEGQDGREGKGKWVSEPHIMDERYAAIDVAGKGLVVFSSCSHAGIVNVIKDAVKTFGRPIYVIIGGLHLAGPEYGPRIPQTVRFLSETLVPAPTYILPMHCSGFQAKIALEAAFGEGCVPAGVGHKVEVLGDREFDRHLMPARILAS